MSFMATDVDNRVRNLIPDTDYKKWTKTERARWINDAVVMIRSDRPDARIDTDGTAITVTELTTINSGAVCLPDKFLAAVVQFVCMMCFQGESGDKRDEDRAKMHQGNYNWLIAHL